MKLDGLRPYIGILGVLLGAVASTLGLRVTTFGLADLRGALHAGFDEGAWITTAYGVGQMAVGVACPYLGAMFGVRRVLFAGIGVFFVASLLAPLSPNLHAFLAMQFLSGLGAGTFIPLTIRFIVASLPPRLLPYGLAAYAVNLEFSLNVSAALEGWYADHWSIAWVHWQYCVLLPLMFVCVWIGVPREPVNTDLMRRHDWPGVAYAALGFGLLYAGLDQGNRLDWAGSGLVVGLLAAGVILVALFAVRELVTSPRPFLDLRILARGDLLILILLLGAFRFIILSTAYIIPVYLQVVQNFRELQIGPVLLFIALPQFALMLPLGRLLTRVDGRWVLAAGALLIGIACVQATWLTADWATWAFLPSQALQAIGQSLALTAMVTLAVRQITPADAMSIGAVIQTARLLGGEVGVAFMQTFVRVREQLHSNLLGLHVDSMAPDTVARLDQYRDALGASLGNAADAANQLLANAVARQASVLAYIDGFTAAAIGAVACILLAAWLQPSPKRG